MKLIFAALALCAVVIGSDMRNDEPWGDDFAQYVAHARNLLDGRAYIDTGHLQEAGVFLAPRAYPPGLPIMLAPIVKWRGFDWRWLKLPQVIGALATLLIWALLARPYIGDLQSALLVLALGLHPAIKLWADFIMSDLIFVAMISLVFLLLERWVDRGTDDHARLWRGALIGLLIGIATTTRTLGIFVLPVVPAIEWLRTRRLSTFSVAAIAVALSITTIEIVALPQQLEYLDEGAAPLPTRLVRGMQWYATDIAALLPGVGEADAHAIFAASRAAAGLAPPYPLTGGPMSAVSIAKIPLIAIGAGLVVFGFFRKSRWRSFDIFLLPFFVVMLTYGSYYSRYLLPLLPLLYFYLFVGLDRLSPLVGRIAIGAGVLAIAGNVVLRSAYEFEAGVEAPAARAFLTFVRESTPPDAILTFSKPRALALLSGRRSFATASASDEARTAMIDKAGARYVVAAPVALDGSGTFAEARPEQYRRVFANGGFEVFERLQPIQSPHDQ